MKMKSVLTSVFVSVISAVTFSVDAGEEVRLVITPKANTVKSEVATQKATPSMSGCVPTPDGKSSWCIGNYTIDSNTKKSVAIDVVTAKSVHRSSGMEIITLDGLGYDAREVAKALTEDGHFGLVEADLEIHQKGTPAVNDNDFIRQEFYLGSSNESKLGMNVIEAWEGSNYFNDGEKVDVWIMDSSFFDNKDVIFTGGASFSTTALEKDGDRQEPHADFRPNPLSLEQGICNGHGVGVAGTVAAQMNNNMAGAGITNNVNLYAGRVMTCGIGFMSDAVNNIEYLLGKQFAGIEPYSGNPGVINLSIGALAEDGCPEYVQEPISRVISAGWVIVASSGNETMPAAHSAPANCEGVISVGSVDKDGELEWFSNYGDGLDLVTAGDWIAAPCEEGDSQFACFWDGTSFSSPLVAGLATAIKSMTGASPELIKQALKATARGEVLGSSCDGSRCGTGVPDVMAAIAFADAVMKGEMNTISFALSDTDTCEQSWFIDNFGASIPICQLYKATFLGGADNNNGYYELVSVDSGTGWEDKSLQVVTTSEYGETYLLNVDIETKDYGVRLCDTAGCSDQIVEMNIAGAREENRPESCKY